MFVFIMQIIISCAVWHSEICGRFVMGLTATYAIYFSNPVVINGILLGVQKIGRLPILTMIDIQKGSGF